MGPKNMPHEYNYGCGQDSIAMQALLLLKS